MEGITAGPWPSIVGARKYALPQGNIFCKTTTLGPGVAKWTKTLFVEPFRQVKMRKVFTVFLCRAPVHFALVWGVSS